MFWQFLVRNNELSMTSGAVNHAHLLANPISSTALSTGRIACWRAQVQAEASVAVASAAKLSIRFNSMGSDRQTVRRGVEGTPTRGRAGDERHRSRGKTAAPEHRPTLIGGKVSIPLAQCGFGRDQTSGGSFDPPAQFVGNSTPVDFAR